jgi:hypothetical protein
MHERKMFQIKVVDLNENYIYVTKQFSVQYFFKENL